jgi:uncharacterized membrane protein YhaH (DUF805 family)
MDVGQWYVSRGRITRRTWWLHYTLPIIVATIVAGIIDAVIGSNFGPEGANFGVLSALVSLALIVPSISSQVTRLHDRSHSAWWLLFNLIPLVGGILLLIQMGFLRGDGGPNRYGPPPAGGTPVPDPGYPPSSYA